jgi:glycerol-3-phosphate dehydrogenase
LEKEIEFILETAGEYLEHKPTRKDVLSVFAGLRPLVSETSGKGDSVSTKEISRIHKIIISPSGLITVIGGKWTTFRQMGEDVVNKIPLLLGMKERVCNTCQLHIHGYAHDLDFDVHWHVYGSDLPDLQDLLHSNTDYSKRIHPKLPYTIGEIVWAVQHEMARTVEDFLARRTRALFLHAQVSIEMAPKVAQIMANELGKNVDWIEHQIQEYTQLAKGYLISEG